MKSVKFFYAILLFLSVSLSAQAIKRFTLWQLPSQINTIGNSYVFRTDKGRIVVMDGGVREEASYLRGFLAALGNEVEAWIVTHPHFDHVGALTEILNNPAYILKKYIIHRFHMNFVIPRPSMRQRLWRITKRLKSLVLKRSIYLNPV